MTITTDRPVHPEHMVMPRSDKKLKEILKEVPEGMFFFSIPDATGDTRLMWDPANRDDTAHAKGQFEELRKKGYTVYAVDPEDGSKGEVLTAFPKRAGKLIAVKQIRGG